MATPRISPAANGTPQLARRGGLVVGGERPEEVVAFESAVVDFFVTAADQLGVPKSVAAIYGIVFASPAALSFAEIESRLAISKGSISQGLRVLRDIGAVRAVDDPGRAPARSASPSPIAFSPSPARGAARYVPDTEMRQLIARFLESRVQPQLAAGKGRLADLRERTTAFAPAHRAILRQRVAKLESWHARARGLLPLVRTFLKLGG